MLSSLPSWRHRGALRHASRRQRRHLFARFVVLLLAIFVGVPLPHARAETSTTTFTPTPLPANTTTVSPDRGLFQWRGQSLAPLPQPAMDVYQRFVWRDLEPSKDHYDFSKLDALAAQARARGGRFMFRVSSFCTAWCPSVAVPDYFLDSHDPTYLARGWWSHGAYVPDWNDPRFLDRAGKLLQALGARYDHDERLGLVQIGIYGNWGEWHVWPLSYPSSSGATNITEANKRLLIDLHARAFPHTQLIMLRGGKGNAGAVGYALGLSATSDPPVAMPVGWAADCWGDDDYEGDLPSLPQWPAMRDRWKIAPVMGEPCATLTAGYSHWPTLAEHVATYHLSLLGNGNIGDGDWSSLPSSAKDAFLRAGNLAGYREQLQQVTLPSTLTPGAPFTLSSSWANTGVAPIYSPWSVRYQLRALGSSSVVWEGQSTLDLRRLLPSGGTPTTSVDHFTLPANLPAGSYDLSAIVRDTATSYRAPLPLAIAGRQADGSYRLGSVTVGAGGGAESGEPAVLIRRIAASADDSEENLRTGWVDLTSSDLELTHDPDVGRDQEVGLRFINIAIPSGATIRQVVLTFTSKYTLDEPTNLVIHGEASGDTQPFAGVTSHDLTSRPKTSATMAWPTLAPWQAGQSYPTPDLAPIVQEIVNGPGWASGHALALFLDGTGHRTAWSVDGRSTASPTLVITYTR